MTGFAQLIEWNTSRFAEVEKLNDEWRERFPTMRPTRVLVCADRDNAGTYVTVVEFSSYEEAMENSKDPATSEYAEKDGGPLRGPAGVPQPRHWPPGESVLTPRADRTGTQGAADLRLFTGPKLSRSW